jgi:hypothetical protein
MLLKHSLHLLWGHAARLQLVHQLLLLLDHLPSVVFDLLELSVLCVDLIDLLLQLLDFKFPVALAKLVGLSLLLELLETVEVV